MNSYRTEPDSKDYLMTNRENFEKKLTDYDGNTFHTYIY